MHFMNRMTQAIQILPFLQHMSAVGGGSFEDSGEGKESLQTEERVFAERWRSGAAHAKFARIPERKRPPSVGELATPAHPHPAPAADGDVNRTRRGRRRWPCSTAPSPSASPCSPTLADSSDVACSGGPDSESRYRRGRRGRRRSGPRAHLGRRRRQQRRR